MTILNQYPYEYPKVPQFISRKIELERQLGESTESVERRWHSWMHKRMEMVKFICGFHNHARNMARKAAPTEEEKEFFLMIKKDNHE